MPVIIQENIDLSQALSRISAVGIQIQGKEIKRVAPGTFEGSVARALYPAFYRLLHQEGYTLSAIQPGLHWADQ